MANVRTLEGIKQGWVSTGVTAQQGDRIRGNASGIINFWGGTYPRNPNGEDEHGVTQIAGGGNPAPGRIRNSLVFRVGGVVVQGGVQFDFACPVSGDIEITNNDDYASDNNGSWSVSFTVVPASQPNLPTPAQVQAFNGYHYKPTPARNLRAARGPRDARFIDENGRPVVFRGVNFGARCKFAPYLPVLPRGWQTNASLAQFGRNEMLAGLADQTPGLDQLRTLGFNIARIPVIWKALEPVPNPKVGSELSTEGRHYLDMLLPIIDALFARGLYVFLDFHQDIAHDSYGGDGFPDWAIGIDAAHPPITNAGFDNKLWATHYHEPFIKPPGYRLDVAQGVRNTLRSFWRNSVTNTRWNLQNYPVQDHLVGVIGQVARYFRSLNGGTGHPAIVGYEVFNEPAQASPEVAKFETSELPSFYGRAHREIRKFDPDAFVFVEPRVDWTTYDNLTGPENNGIGFTVAPKTALDVRRQGTGVAYAGSAVADDRVVFSFHHYDPWVMAEHLGAFMIHSPLQDKEREWPGTYDIMCNAANERGLIPFLSELGGHQQWLEDPKWRREIDQGHFIRGYMELQLRQVESRALSMTYWNYDLYNKPQSGDGWNHEDFSLLGPNHEVRQRDLVTRPYALRAKGSVSRFYFDVVRKVGAVSLRSRPNEDVFATPAVIFVPVSELGTSFVVRTSAKYVRWDPQAQLLYWLPIFQGGGACLLVHTVSGFDPSQLPSDLQNQLAVLTFARTSDQLVGPVD